MKKIFLQLAIVLLAFMIASEVICLNEMGKQGNLKSYASTDERFDSLLKLEHGLNETLSKGKADPFLLVEQSRTNRKFPFLITRAARNNEEGYYVNIKADFRQTLRLIDELESNTYHNLKSYRIHTSGKDLLTELEFHY